MVAGMSVLADQLERGEPVEVVLLEGIVVFLRTFAVIAATMVRRSPSCSRP
jgi:hypothetical protein